MKRFAMEDDTPEMTPEEVSTKVTDLISDNSELEARGEEIREATEIEGVIDTYASDIQTRIEAQQPLTENEVRSISTAVEHFQSRLGYKKKVFPAMESFSNPSDSMAATKLALENLNQLQAALNTQLQVANEGFIDSTVSWVKNALDTESKVLDSFLSACSEYTRKGMKETDINNPKFGKYIGNGSGTSGKDVLSFLNKMSETLSDSTLSKLIDEMTHCVEKATKEIRGNWFVSNKRDIERIKDIQKEVENKATLVEKLVKTKGTNSSASSFKPITPEELKQFESVVVKILKDHTVTDSLDKNLGKQGSLKLWAVWQRNFRLKSGVAGTYGLVSDAVAMGKADTGKKTDNDGIQSWLTPEDIREAHNVRAAINSILSEVRQLVKNRLIICRAVSEYVKASAK